MYLSNVCFSQPWSNILMYLCALPFEPWAPSGWLIASSLWPPVDPSPPKGMSPSFAPSASTTMAPPSPRLPSVPPWKRNSCRGDWYDLSQNWHNSVTNVTYFRNSEWTGLFLSVINPIPTTIVLGLHNEVRMAFWTSSPLKIRCWISGYKVCLGTWAVPFRAAFYI